MSQYYEFGGGGAAITIGPGGLQNFYIASGGSDSANGLTPGTAWATLQHAMNYMALNVNFAGGTALWNVGAGTFAGFINRFTAGGGLIQLLGAGSGLTTLNAISDPSVNLNAIISFSSSSNTAIFVNGVTFDPVLTFAPAFRSTAPGLIVGFGDRALGGNPDIIFNLDQQGSGMLNMAQASLCRVIGFNSPGTATINMGNGTMLPMSIIKLGEFDDGWAWTVTGSGGVPFGWCFVATQGIYTKVVATGPSYTVTGSQPTGNRAEVWNGAAIGEGSNYDGLGPFFFPGTLPIVGDLVSSYDGYFIPFPPNNQTANYTLASTDINSIVEMNVAAANTVTIPPFATLHAPTGTKITIVQTGVGATSVVAGAGVTLLNGGAVGGQYTGRDIYHTEITDTWIMVT